MNFHFAPPDDALESRRIAASARYTPRVVPLISPLIGGSVIIAFVCLVAQAFFRQGLAAWSAGLAYIFYDTCLLAFTGWQARKLYRPPNPAVSDVPRPTLAVIIAAHNEEHAIAVTIDALAAQTDAPDLILVADDGSTDGMGDVLETRYGLTRPEFGQTCLPGPVMPSLRWLRLPQGGKARVLNAALAMTDCDIVLTVDADTLVETHAIAVMRESFRTEPALVAATGVLTPVCGKGPVARFFQWFQTYEYVRNFVSRYAWMQLNGLLLISGAFAAFRRDALVTVGGFDPDCLVEDYELIHRLHRWSAEHGKDWTVRVIGAARARTDAPETIMSFLRQRRRWFAGFLQTQRWNRDMTGNARFGKLGTAMMPVKALDTLQPIYGLAAFILLIGFVAAGRYALAFPILLVMIGKIVVDISFHLWCLGHYRRWTGDRQSAGAAKALFAAVLEPFSFQLMRHAGAAWGWWTFLTGQHSWGRQSRRGIVAQAIARLPY
ncbi:MAG: glycosyltransferase family 2 protein [Sphingomonadales bacterium]|jgi:cellulose synthase/poly-beta-1,6-N-acetylglucosamine synthase-like glycosyltransferase|nr:glycosyltransferase family 2 protein [Sphingomonadales bacterium]MBK8861848.1 glycosyltransferase family 2 protein [Sphingomonadales bacterium]